MQPKASQHPCAHLQVWCMQNQWRRCWGKRRPSDRLWIHPNLAISGGGSWVCESLGRCPQLKDAPLRRSEAKGLWRPVWCVEGLNEVSMSEREWIRCCTRCQLHVLCCTVRFCYYLHWLLLPVLLPPPGRQRSGYQLIRSILTSMDASLCASWSKIPAGQQRTAV